MLLYSGGELMQENHYYPYGMLIEGLSNEGTASPKNMYKYGDKEWQNEIDQKLLDFGWRQYDPVIARWHVTDPAEQFYNPYLVIGANPVSLIDPDGRKSFTSPNSAIDLPLPNGDIVWSGGRGSFNVGAYVKMNPYDQKNYLESLGINNTIATYAPTELGITVACNSVNLPNGTVVLTNFSTGEIVGTINGANGSYHAAVAGQTLEIRNGQLGVLDKSTIAENYEEEWTFNNGAVWIKPVYIISDRWRSLEYSTGNYSSFSDWTLGISMVSTLITEAATAAGNYMPKYVTSTPQMNLNWKYLAKGGNAFGAVLGTVDNSIQAYDQFSEGNYGYGAINTGLAASYLAGGIMLATPLAPIGAGIILGTAIVDYANAFYRRNNP